MAPSLAWWIYGIILVIFLFIFALIWYRGRSEYRPYNHQRFSRLRIGCLVVDLLNIIWALQLEFNQIKIISISAGLLCEAIIAVLICFVIFYIIRNYFALKCQIMPAYITYFLYIWCFITLTSMLCKLLSNSINDIFTDDLVTYSLFVDITFNGLFFCLLMTFIFLFTAWILVQYHKIRIMDESDSNITLGGEKDDAAYKFILRLIGFLCGFCVYFGLLIAGNIYAEYALHTSNEMMIDYDEYGIILFCIVQKFVLYSTLSLYVLPSTDNYLSVSPNILRSLNINTASIQPKKKSTFKDPNASDKWAFHAGYYVQDDEVGDDVMDAAFSEDCDLESNVSYTTLMFRDQQKQKQDASKQSKHWFSYFMPSPSPSPDKSGKRNKSQAQVGNDNLNASLQSIHSVESMYSDGD